MKNDLIISSTYSIQAEKPEHSHFFHNNYLRSILVALNNTVTQMLKTKHTLTITCISLPAKVSRQILQEGIVQEELGQI